MIRKLLALFLITVALQAREIDLSLCEKSITSQNGEDGVLQTIFQELGVSTGFCVEFGAYDGMTGSNTYLLRLQGWKALLLDRMVENRTINLQKEFITAENINDLFKKYEVAPTFDLLSIDIDYNDFYIWKAIDSVYQPAVVVIEYNGTHTANEDKVVKYRPYYAGDGCNYFGASIRALYNLGRSKGYSLVYAENSGTNLFFVRDALLQEKGLTFKNMNDPEKLYRKPTYGKGPNGGHRADEKNRTYLISTELLKQK
jgi:hypothetical protein